MTQKTVFDVSVGSTAATMPLWASQSQDWFIWVAAIAGGTLAILRLGVFCFEQYVRLQAFLEARRNRKLPVCTTLPEENSNG